MNKAQVREWYLEIHGIKTGPYTPEQVQGLLEEGEILVTTAVFHTSQAQLPANQIEWFTAGEFVNGFRDYVSTNHPIVKVAPPEKPHEKPHEEPKIFSTPELEKSQTPESPPSHTIDDLFETLLLARDRKNQIKMTPPSPEEWGTLSRGRLPITPTVAFAAALGLVFLIAIWGMVTLFRHKPSSDVSSANTTPRRETKTPPAPPPAQVPARPSAPQQPRRANPPPQAPVRPAPIQPDRHERDERGDDHRSMDPPPIAEGEPVPSESPPAQPHPETAHFEEGGRLEGAGPVPENSPVSETPPSEIAPQQFQ